MKTTGKETIKEEQTKYNRIKAMIEKAEKEVFNYVKKNSRIDSNLKTNCSPY